MQAIVVAKPGGPESLQWTEIPDPECASDEVVIDIVAAGINRADVMQRMGQYPPPAGITDTIGLECSGTIKTVGADVRDWTVGDQVCALLSGGGYATQVVVPAVQLLPVPDGLTLIEAASLPEVASTVWSNLFASFSAGRLAPGETLLVHGGSSGIGTMAIQLAVANGNHVIVTVGSSAKAQACLALGAQAAINYKDEDFVERAREQTDGRGVDVILDSIGAKYLARNLAALAPGGRLVTIGLQGGRKAELDLGSMLPRRLSVAATSLRGRPVHGPGGKAEIVAGVRAEVWPFVADSQIKPVVDTVLPMSDAQQAHERLESSAHIGKIVLTTDSANSQNS